jgi:glycosyltransferase involved in cell wall biosynthesis
VSDDLAILIDGRPFRHYPFGKPGFSGGSELYVRRLATGLAALGHTVHVLTSDLDHEEQRGPTEWWWPPSYHPMRGDVVMAAHSLETMTDLAAPLLVLLPNGGDPPTYGRDHLVDAVACFSEAHADILRAHCPTIPRDRFFVTGLGADPNDSANAQVFGRMLYANDPARGLWHVLDIFDRVHEAIPEATLHITYDFDRQFEQHRWHATAMAELLWNCKHRIETTAGITSLGALGAEAMRDEQMACYVHAMPSDPPNAGSQTHGLTQLELAAAGVPLVLSDIESFPELFSDCATILPVVGSLRKSDGEGSFARVDAQDYADAVIELMREPQKWTAASAASRKVAARHTWDAMSARFEAMLGDLVARLQEGVAA